MRFAYAAAALALFAATPALAQAQPVAPTAGAMHGVEGTILSVSAEGSVQATPDMATINMGVMTEAPTAAAALSENAQRMSALIAALRRAGVAERDIQTSNVSVNPQQVYRENEGPRVTGYQANNQVNVKVRNLDRLGRTIDAAVNAGGNTVHGVNFSFQNPDEQMDGARREAVREARERADFYAQALGMRVVRLISMSEGSGYAPPIPMPVMARMESADMSTPIAPGEAETRVNVNAVFELR